MNTKKSDCMMCKAGHKKTTMNFIPVVYQGERKQLQIASYDFKKAFNIALAKFCHAAMNDNQLCL